MDDLLGYVVVSRRGRDAGRHFLVVAQEDKYVFYADGRCHPAEHPKRKKIKHIEPLGKSAITQFTGLTNRMLREAIIASEEVVKAERQTDKEE